MLLIVNFKKNGGLGQKGAKTGRKKGALPSPSGDTAARLLIKLGKPEFDGYFNRASTAPQ
jgi:hypothetical protein